MRISDWSSDVCSSDLVTEREKQTSFCKVSWASGNRLGDRSVLITGRRTSTGYCVRTNSMFLFGKGVTDGVASELLGTISRILDESGKPFSARAIVKAPEQSGQQAPGGEPPWKPDGGRPPGRHTSHP